MKYRCTCPHCGQYKVHPNYTRAMLDIPHPSDCPYVLGGLPTQMITEVMHDA